MPKLFLSTTGTNVAIPELGITITHPTTDFEIDAQFTAEELKLAPTLTSAINAGTLVWKKTAGGSAQPAADYDSDYTETEELGTGTGNIDQQLVKALGSSILSLTASVNVLANSTFTATRGTSTVLIFTGSTSGQIFKLPNATTLSPGHQFEIWNMGTVGITVKDDGSNTLFTISQTSVAYFRLRDNSTSNGAWLYWQVFVSSLASGILNYNIVSTTPFSTSATTDTLITGFTVTPQAGTYAIWYNATILYTTTPRIHEWTIFRAGSQIADSRRQQITSRSNQTMFDSTQTIASFDGSQSCDVRVRCDASGGNITVNGRSLILIRLGS